MKIAIGSDHAAFKLKQTVKDLLDEYYAASKGELAYEFLDPLFLVHRHNAEGRSLRPRHRQAADGDVGAGVHMLRQHQAVILLVDVIAGQDDDVFGVVTLDDVDVLRSEDSAEPAKSISRRIK